MVYTVNKLSKLSGVTTRTLRYYDEIGLLKPERVGENGYRIYGQVQVDTLQQILFFRELGFALDEIKEIISSSDFDRKAALQHHLTSLLAKKHQIEALVENVSKTLSAMEGEAIMNDSEKFIGFKNKIIEENEKLYGNEVREKYGNEAVNASNAKLAGMSQEQWKMQNDLSNEIAEALKAAMEIGDPSCDAAQKACDLHRQWVSMFWKTGTYSKGAHLALAEMYVADERFKAYYEKIADGAAEFFLSAMKIYCV